MYNEIVCSALICILKKNVIQLERGENGSKNYQGVWILFLLERIKIYEKLSFKLMEEDNWGVSNYACHRTKNKKICFFSLKISRFRVIQWSWLKEDLEQSKGRGIYCLEFNEEHWVATIDTRHEIFFVVTLYFCSTEYIYMTWCYFCWQMFFLT